MISADGRSISCWTERAEDRRAVLHELVLGPALSLALALRGVFCLHAGAVEIDGRVVAFPGFSGAGKSTLVSRLGWRRAADDILPVGSAPPVTARPWFPQLKLELEEQPALRLPEALPLAAIYCLEPPAGSVAVGRLSSRDEVIQVVRHTVAARLFGPDLLARHLDFCAEVASRVPVRTLAYPRELGIGPQVREAIAADLGLLSARLQDAAR